MTILEVENQLCTILMELSTSQINYILSNDDKIIQCYAIGQKNSFNVSSHVPVEVLLGVSSEQRDSHCYLKKGQDKSKKVYCWNKLNQEQFI